MTVSAFAHDGAMILQHAEEAIRVLPMSAPIDRVVVLGTTGSTQDDARRLALGKPGLVVMAEHQTKGRGRLGRLWADISMMSLPATFAIRGWTPEHLSLASGIAACRTVEAFLPSEVGVGIRWPNDVVEIRAGGAGRKLSGVLIEAADGLHLVGIGINVLHEERHWPPELVKNACSLRQLGCETTRAHVAAELITNLARALMTDPAELVEQWRRRNVLVGQRCVFIHNGVTHAGVVQDIDPANEIVLEVTPSRVVRLPALTTSMVK